MDPHHPGYEPGNRFERVIRTTTSTWTTRSAELLERFDDDTTVLVVSDHGAQADGRRHLHQRMADPARATWSLHEQPAGPTRVRDAEGRLGADARLGRGRLLRPGLPQCRGPRAAGRHRAGGLRGVPRPAGRARSRPCPATRRPADRHAGPPAARTCTASVNGIAPDLIVYFGDLAWRSVGTVGAGQIHTFENDTGPDDANHDRHGLLIMAGPGVPAERREDMSILDVAPTILAKFRPPPAGMTETAADLYLDLLKRCVLNLIYEDLSFPQTLDDQNGNSESAEGLLSRVSAGVLFAASRRQVFKGLSGYTQRITPRSLRTLSDFDREKRLDGQGFPERGPHHDRHAAVRQRPGARRRVLRNDVPGDLIETGRLAGRLDDLHARASEGLRDHRPLGFGSRTRSRGRARRPREDGMARSFNSSEQTRGPGGRSSVGVRWGDGRWPRDCVRARPIRTSATTSTATGSSTIR